MNNKSFYALIGFVAIIDLLFVIRPSVYGFLATRAILCGSALYFIVSRLRMKKRKFSPFTPFMIVFALLYNPIVSFHLPEWSWLLLDMVALVTFYLLSKSSAISSEVVFKDLFPLDDDSEYNKEDNNQ